MIDLLAKDYDYLINTLSFTWFLFKFIDNKTNICTKKELLFCLASYLSLPLSKILKYDIIYVLINKSSSKKLTT